MSRSRRRNRRLHFLGHHRGAGDAAAHRVLKPLYVSGGEWNTVYVGPVLAIEGLSDMDQIHGPALALEEPALQLEEVLESDDPAQLELAVADEAETMDAMPDEAVETVEAVETIETIETIETAPESPAHANTDSAAQQGELELTSEAEEDLAAVAELEILTAAARADAHVADVAAEMVARAIEATAEPAPEVVEPPPPPEPAPPPPDPVELLYGSAQAAAAEGRSEEARQLFRQVLAQRPTHLAARNQLALLLEAAGDHKAALAELDRALDGDQDHVGSLVNRGALLGTLGRFAAAERDLKRALRSDPAHAEALYHLGVVMTRKGLWGEAVPALRRAIELDPAKAQAHFYLGEALNHVDDLAGAMLAYQRAAELAPDHSRALYGLGIVLDRLGRPDDAAQMYKRSREVAATRR